MEALTNILSKVGSTVGQIGKVAAPVAQPALGVLGMLRNITGRGSQDALMRRMLGYEKQMESIANNPAAIMARARQVQQPLSTGLVEDVMNQVQAQLMERGLSSSPQIATQVTSQALAPYELEQQRLALQTVMQALGLPMQAAGAVPPFEPTDTSSFWQSFLPQSKPTIDTSTWPKGSSIPTTEPGLAPSAVPGVWPGYMEDNWGSNLGGYEG